MDSNLIAKGDKVTFTGFTSNEDDRPDNADQLEVGTDYVVIDINDGEGDEEKSYSVGVPNEKYNPDKRKTKNNQPWAFLVDVFDDEFEFKDAEDEPEAEEEQIEAKDVKKGSDYTITDSDGPVSGTVTKKTRTSITLLEVQDDGSTEAVTFEVKEIDSIVAGTPADLEEKPEAEEEPEPEKKTPTKTKTKTKTKTPAKTKAKDKTKTEPKEESKPARAIKGEELKGLTILSDDDQDSEILGMIEDAEEGVIGLVEELVDEAGNVDYKLGGVLYNAWIEGDYKGVDDGSYDGEKGFERYCDEHVGIGYRKAMYLMKVYATFNKYGISSEVVAEIGWSKAAEISGSVDGENKDDLVQLARDNTVKDLKSEIKEIKAHKGEDTRKVVKKTIFKFRIPEDSGKTIQGYLDRASEELEIKDLGELFEHIVSEWSTEHLDVSATKKSSRGRGRGRK